MIRIVSNNNNYIYIYITRKLLYSSKLWCSLKVKTSLTQTKLIILCFRINNYRVNSNLYTHVFISRNACMFFNVWYKFIAFYMIVINLELIFGYFIGFRFDCILVKYNLISPGK